MWFNGPWLPASLLHHGTGIVNQVSYNNCYGCQIADGLRIELFQFSLNANWQHLRYSNLSIKNDKLSPS